MFKFNKNIYDQEIKIEPIEPLLTDSMVLISGDFWGIQKFIFDRLSTKNASKVLRAKSAFIQIFTEYITQYICDKLKIDKEYIISESAGKFEIIVPKESIDLKEIQKSIDDYFRDNFYGINGVVLSAIECKREDFLDEKRYRDLRDIKIPNQIEKDRFKKFDLLKTDYLLEYDTNIDNQTLCKICNIRKIDKDDSCKICKKFKELGRKLTSINHFKLKTDTSRKLTKQKVQNFKADFINDFSKNIQLTKRVKSYVPREKDKDEPLDFDEIAKNSCGGKEIGIKSLAVIKADVDDMGKFLRENSDITKDFESFNYFSKGLDSFFSEYIVDILREKDGNIYTVFTGGDDLFLIGAWDEVLEFSRFIRNRFREYVNEKLTISFGIALIKPAYPIARLADVAEDLLEDNSKKLEGKDAITLFNETVKWDSYLDIYEKLESAFKGYDNIATTTLYRLIDFCEMSKKVKYENDIKSTIWKSKLNYLFYRNMKNSDEQLMKSLSQNIEESPEETKMFLFEFLYKRRKS